MGMPKKKEAGPEHGDEFPEREGHVTTLQAEMRGGGTCCTSTSGLEKGSNRPSSMWVSRTSWRPCSGSLASPERQS